MLLDFTSGFYQSISPQNANLTCINWFVNVAEQKTLSQENLLPCPGIALHDSGQELEVNRGGILVNGVPYFVCGQRLYRISRTVTAGVEFFTRQDMGEVLGTSRVDMAEGGGQLAIVVPGEYYYIFKTSDNSLTLITDSDFDGPFDSVCFVDSAFYLNKTNSKKIIQTSVNDGTTTDPLHFSNPTAEPNRIVRVFEYRGELWAAGTQKIIPYRFIGGAGFVQQPVPGGVLPYGIRSVHALVKLKNSFIWLASGQEQEPSVYLYSGGDPEPISTEPVDKTIQNKTDFEVDNTFFLRYAQNGEDFVFLTLGETTFGFCYRASRLSGRKIWFERKSRIGEQDRFWRVTSIVQGYNRLFVGDAVDGRIGILSDTEGEEYGNPIIRRMRTRPFESEAKPFGNSAIKVVMDGSGGDNYISLAWANNSRQFTQPISLPIGDKGEYGNEIEWRRLGRFHRSRTFELSTSSTIPPAINQLIGQFS